MHKFFIGKHTFKKGSITKIEEEDGITMVNTVLETQLKNPSFIQIKNLKVKVPANVLDETNNIIVFKQFLPGYSPIEHFFSASLINFSLEVGGINDSRFNSKNVITSEVSP